jgi:hypothetical protein
MHECQTLVELGICEFRVDIGCLTECVQCLAVFALRESVLRSAWNTESASLSLSCSASSVAYMAVGLIPKDPNANFKGYGVVDGTNAAKIARYYIGKIPAL